jgi:transcriptional regulator with XRE-family HTH domain
MPIKDKIEAVYGNTNKFVDCVRNTTSLSPSHLYRLINGTAKNPTMSSLVELARITNIPLEEILGEYSSRHREQGPRNI